MRRHRSVRPIALATLIALGAGLLGVGATSAASAASAADKPKPPPSSSARLTFGIQPATKGVPDSRASYRYAVTPGGTLKDQVAVRNLSTSSVTLRVYATDAVNVEDGGFGLLPRAQRPRDVGTWLTIGGRDRVTVKARSFVVLPLSLKVPRNAQPGDHTGGIVVSVTTLTRNATGTNVELDQRVGARVFVRVSGPQRPELTIKPVHADYQHVLNPFGLGSTRVTYRVTNTGNINLGGRQRVSVQGLIGSAQLSPSIPDAELLLPGGSLDVTTSVQRTWPLLRERVTVTIDPLVQQGDQVAGLTTYSGTAAFWAVPWSLLVLVLTLVVALFVRLRIRRTRRANALQGEAKPRAPAHRAKRREAAGVSLTVVALLLAPAAAVLLAPGTAYAESAPFTDANATGGVTLCSAQGQPVTNGRTDRPIAAMAVSGTAAVAPYDANGRTAGLFAYQPRRGIDPGNWSGQGLTALSRYSNPKHPMVEILPRDYTFGGFVQAYPPQWDGLVQLRVFLRAPNQPTATYTYAATTVKVTGTTWRQLGPPAGAPCNVGRARSVIRLMGLPTAAPTVKASGAKATPSSPATRSAPTSSSSSPTGSATASTKAPNVLVKAAQPSSLASADNGDGTNPQVWAVSVAGAGAVLLAVALLLWRLVRSRPGRRERG